MKILQEIPPKIAKGTWVGVDIEMFGLDDHTMHLPNSGEFACMQIALPDETVYIITDTKDIAPALKAINNTMWVLQKGQFDLAHLRRWAKVPDRELLWDTMYVDKIIWGGYWEQFSFSLADMVRRYFSIYLDKSVRETFITATELTEEQIRYAAEDALWTLRVAQKQQEFMTKDMYELIWQDIDLPATYAFLASKPFRIDRIAWEKLAEENLELKKNGDKLLPFNPRSKQQVIAYWKKNGYVIENSAAATLEDWIENNEDASIVDDAKLALKVKKASTYASRYGMGFLEKYLLPEEDYWVVKPDYFTIGAETGRVSASNPPMHQIPSRDTLEFRRCFIARPGHKLVIADYSSQEPRIAAFLSQDKKFIEIVNSGEDIYLLSGANVFTDPDENLRNRKRVKDVVLGSFYGLSPFGLSKRWGVSKGAASDFIEAIFAPFPKLKRYLDSIAKRTTYVETVIGRRIWLNPYSYQCPNNARNAPIQGTAADMMKRALVVKRMGWQERWDDYFNGTRWPLVECVHDESGYDVLEQWAEEVADYVSKTMISVAETMCPGVLFEVDTHICDNWAEAKGT